MLTLTGRLLASTVRHLVAGSRQMSLVNQIENGFVVEFDGVLRINLSASGEQIAVAFRAGRRCSPNHYWAAQADLNKAFLAATKEVFHIKYDQQVPS